MTITNQNNSPLVSTQASLNTSEESESHLLHRHIEDLKSSGLSDETIAVSGCFSASATDVKKILGFSAGPGLVFHYPGVILQNNQFYRVKPDTPLIIDGKAAKYLTPSGGGNHLYIPSNLSGGILSNASISLIITEGEKKSLKACQEGFPTIGLSGVWCFRDQGHNLIPDFDQINLEGRMVFIAFDSDIVEKPEIKSAEWRLAITLRQRGVTIVPIRFQCGSDGQKCGLDDYLIEFGPDKFRVLMKECRESPLAKLIKFEADLVSDLSSKSVEIGKDFFKKYSFYTIKPLPDLKLKIENIRENKGRFSIEFSAGKNNELICTDRIDPVSERQRRDFIKKLGYEQVQQEALIGKLNHLPRVIKELKRFQRLHTEADKWVQNIWNPDDDPSKSLPLDQREEALKLLRKRNLLYQIGEYAERMGIAGERGNTIIAYLSITSRILKNPISLLIKADSSSGKSYLVKNVLRFFPDNAYKEVTGMSKQALIYSDESYSHKTIVICEYQGMNEALYNIRALQSEGKLIFETVMEDPKTGRLKTERIEKEGPTNFIVTTTRLKIHYENETRNWSIFMDESEDQTKKVKDKIAERYSTLHLNPSFLKGFQNAQRLLKYYPVRIPYAEFLSERTPNKPLRIRRDFQKLLTAIEVITLLHQHQRELKEDSEVQYLEATLEDYYMAVGLFGPIFKESLSGTNPKTTRAVEAVLELCHGGGSTTLTILMDRLGVSRDTVLRWLKPAIHVGEVIVNESKGRNPTTFEPGMIRYDLGEFWLPSLKELAQAFPLTDHYFSVVHPINGTVEVEEDIEEEKEFMESLFAELGWL